MEQVVLHTGDDVPKIGQISGQNAVAVHSAKLGGNAMRLPEDFHKQVVGGLVCPKIIVNKVQVFSDKPDSRRPDAFQLGVFLQDKEYFQQG